MQRRSFVHATTAAALTAGLGLGLLGAGTARAAGHARVVRFGQSASLSGGQAGYGKDVRDGIAAAFAAASAAEASHGLRFELVTLDDGGLRGHCVQNVKSLADSDVVGLIGLTSGAGAEACMPVVEEARIAMLGTASGNMGIRSAQAKGAFHVRAGYDAEFHRMAANVKEVGLQRVGVVTLGDTSQANLQAMTQALQALEINPKTTVAIDRNATRFDAVANQLLAARLDGVMFTANAEPVAQIIEHMRLARYTGLFYASSFAGQDLVDTLMARKRSCVMSMVVPRPNALGVSVVAQCRRDLALLKKESRLGMTTLEGYIAGRTAVEATLAAQRAGGVSRSRLREAIAGLRSDLGGYKVDFGGSTQGSRFVDLISVDRYGRLVG
ncbi:MAG: ABC transporter substrate-binding protein [Burkholderiales bacterium]|nr:ABC transporter substrate-binding protein [Burkholderiales bacterium]